MNSLSDIVISEKMAPDVFGKEDPIGKPLQLRLNDSWQAFTVTGVINNAPKNSTFDFDAVDSQRQCAGLSGEQNPLGSRKS